MPSRMTLELHREKGMPGRARAALEPFRAELGPDRLEAARLLLTEFVTNVVKYGGTGPVQVDLSSNGVFRAEVIDDGCGFAAPKRDAADLKTPGGWGLHLVDTLADRWGTYEGSTHVWFELERTEPFGPANRG